MPATYDVTGHPLLSAAAQNLDPGPFDAYAISAESTLGFRATAFTGADLEDAKIAIVRQLNRTLEWEKNQGVTSIKKAGQSQSFSEGGTPIDHVAKAIADRLNGRKAAGTSQSVGNTATF